MGLEAIPQEGTLVWYREPNQELMARETVGHGGWGTHYHHFANRHMMELQSK